MQKVVNKLCVYKHVCILRVHFCSALLLLHVVVQNFSIIFLWYTFQTVNFNLLMYFKYCVWIVCLHDVNAVEWRCWEQYCGGIWLVSSALYSWWQDYCRWSDRYSAILCFVCLLLLWSRICISYAWNILSIEVHSSGIVFFFCFVIITVKIIL